MLAYACALLQAVYNDLEEEDGGIKQMRSAERRITDMLNP
jgi:hypothetical protein